MLSYGETCVELAKHDSMRKLFDGLLDPSRLTEARVATHKKRDAATPTGANGLPVALQIPAGNEEVLIAPVCDELADRGRITSRETAYAGARRAIVQETVFIARQEINVPTEGNAIPFSLFLFSGAMSEVNVQVCASRQFTEEGRLILDRVTCEDSETIQGRDCA